MIFSSAFGIILLIFSTLSARAMECAEAVQYASSYQAALVNCIACNTTANHLSFADANSICPGVATTWCMNNDNSCSNSKSGCNSSVISCESPKPKPNPNPSPNPQSPKPSNPTTPVAGAASPSSIDEERAYPIGKSDQPNTQNPQQGQQQQPPANGQAGAAGQGTPGLTLPWNRSANSLPPTQLPGTPAPEPGSGKGVKAGQSGIMSESKDARSVKGSSTKAVARDEFDNPIRSASTNLKGKVVPNNSGGPIPTSETSAQLPPKPQKGVVQSSYRKLGDLNTGSVSGGGASVTPAQVVSFEDETSSSGDRRPSSTSPGEFQNINLDSYLPGGANDRRRRLLMGEVLSSGEIHNRTVDLFRRITIRMAEFCANGQLLDCR